MITYENRYSLKNKFFEILEERSNAKNIINGLSNEGDLLIIGGSVRDYFENHYRILPRDFDIIVNTSRTDLSSYFGAVKFTTNRYGGYKVLADELTFDIWSINNTWAFKHNKVLFNTLEDLTRTVFFNYDSIIYNLSSCEIYDGGYERAVSEKILDIVLDDNPFPTLNVLRALVYRKTYNLMFSEKLHNFILEWISITDNPLKSLLNIQASHYGIEKMSRDELNYSIEQLY
jgi:hypothetical protein